MLKFYRLKIKETTRGKHYTIQKRKIFRKWKDMEGEYFSEKSAIKAAENDAKIITRYKRII